MTVKFTVNSCRDALILNPQLAPFFLVDSIELCGCLLLFSPEVYTLLEKRNAGTTNLSNTLRILRLTGAEYQA